MSILQKLRCCIKTALQKVLHVNSTERWCLNLHYKKYGMSTLQKGVGCQLDRKVRFCKSTLQKSSVSILHYKRHCMSTRQKGGMSSIHNKRYRMSTWQKCNVSSIHYKRYRMSTWQKGCVSSLYYKRYSMLICYRRDNISSIYYNR